MEIKSLKLAAELPPKENNPRNSEGSFIQLKDGRIAYAFSRFGGESFDDGAQCDICVIYSQDNGNSFDTDNVDTIVRASDYNVKNVMSVTLCRMNNGDIGVFYLVKNPDETSTGMLRRYKDTFDHLIGEKTCFHAPETYFVLNNDRVLRCSDGKWIIPVACFRTSESAADIAWKATNRFYVSEDDGFTWKGSAETVQINDCYSSVGLQEPGMIELPDKTLYAYARTDRMCQYETFSKDGGVTWTLPRPSKFVSPLAPMSIKRNPYSGKYYAVWNPILSFNSNHEFQPWGNDKVTLGRTPLVIAESDDGLNFGKMSVLEDSKENGYCYCAIHFLDEKTMLLAYCSGGVAEGMTLAKSTIKKLMIK